MKTSSNDASNNEVIAAIHGLSSRVERVETANGEILEAIQAFSEQVDTRFSRLETDVTRIKATMVTKDYLDEKLAVHYSDLVLRMQKEDKKH
jgi:hypothetical protein